MDTTSGALFVIAVILVVKYGLLSIIWRPPTDPDPNQDECRSGGSQLTKSTHSKSGIVRVIRLTDDGEFADRCELTDAIYEIRNPRQPELIVWYIHGWKHNAKGNDSDLREFESLIKELVGQQEQLGESGRHVVGIYVGWDGAVGPALLQNLTFWRRKRAADRISQSRSANEDHLFGEICKKAGRRSDHVKRPDDNDRTQLWRANSLYSNLAGPP